MASSNIETMRSAFPEQTDEEAAALYAQQYGYVGIVAYKATVNASDFTTIGCCISSLLVIHNRLVDDFQIFFDDAVHPF